MELSGIQIVAIVGLFMLFNRLMKVEKKVSSLQNNYNRLRQEAYTDDSSAENFNPSQPVQDTGSAVGNYTGGANMPLWL